MFLMFSKTYLGLYALQKTWPRAKKAPDFCIKGNIFNLAVFDVFDTTALTV